MKTLREIALEKAVESTLARHEKFGHPGGSDHQTDTVCWLEESVLRTALMVPEADSEPIQEIQEYFAERADVADGPEGPVPDRAMRFAGVLSRLLGGNR